MMDDFGDEIELVDHIVQQRRMAPPQVHELIPQMIVGIFNDYLVEGIKRCPINKTYVVVHVFSGQMSIYCDYYDDLDSIAKGIAFGIIDAQGAVEVKAIYDVKDKLLVYCDLIGMVSTIHSTWETLTKTK
jgi:hypothetical protein